MQQTSRVLWVDACKGIAIIFVVFGHVWRGLFEAGLISNWQLFELVDRAVYIWHMPLFFTVSGLFFYRSAGQRGFRDMAETWASNLLWPILLWSYIIGAVRVLAGNLTNRDPLSLADLALYPFPPKDIFWFLWALFLIQFAVYFVANMSKSVRPLVLGAMTTVSVLYILSGSDLLILDQALLHFPYFILGLCFGLSGGLVGLPRWQAGFGALLFIASVALAASAPQRLSGLLDFLVGATAVLGLVFLAAGLSHRLNNGSAARVLIWLGGLTMPIYVAHVIALAGARILLLKVGVDSLTIHVLVGVLGGLAVPIGMKFAVDQLKRSRQLGMGPVVFKPAIGVTR